MLSISIGVAFAAGLASFLSPCVLPIIPGFLAYLAGVSLDDSNANRRKIFLHSIFFVLGFSLVFALLGVILSSLLASFAYEAQVWLSRAGGAMIIFFGLSVTGLIEVPFLNRPHVLKVQSGGKAKYVTSFLFGLAFAAGWTPCVGAALGAILGLAASEPSFAFALLFSYALGLGLPFLAVGLFAGAASRLAAKYEKVGKVVNIVFGALLVVIGVLIFTGNLSRVADFGFLNRWLLGLMVI